MTKTETLIAGLEALVRQLKRDGDDAPESVTFTATQNFGEDDYDVELQFPAHENDPEYHGRAYTDRYTILETTLPTEPDYDGMADLARERMASDQAERLHGTG